MSVYVGPNVKQNNITNVNGIVTDQLQLFYDSARSFSYSGTGSTWKDLSGNGRDATLYSTGGVTYSLTTPAAPTYSTDSLGIFTFDGTNDWGKFSNYSFPANVTVSTWIKTSSTALSKGIISNCSGGPVGLVYGIDAGKMWYYYYTTSWQTAVSTSSVNDGNWKNIVWAKTGTSMKMYINGTLDTTVTLTGSASALMNCIGCGWGPCNSDSYGAGTDSYGMAFPGSISLMMIHSKELSLVEITQNFVNTKRRYGI